MSETASYDVASKHCQALAHGVDGGREYLLAESAFRPAGYRSPVPASLSPTRSVEYNSFDTLKTDRTKHSRKVHEPVTRSSAPLTSSQNYGWEAKLWEARRQENRGATNHPRTACRETKFAQSIIIGAKQVHGYAGQGTM